jgi:hypothetical protein
MLAPVKEAPLKRHFRPSHSKIARTAKATHAIPSKKAPPCSHLIVRALTISSGLMPESWRLSEK